MTEELKMFMKALQYYFNDQRLRVEFRRHAYAMPFSGSDLDHRRAKVAWATGFETE